MIAATEGLVETLNSRRKELERVAESLGVAAQAVDSAVLTPAQMRLVASGLREVQGELHDLSDNLRLLVARADMLYSS